MQRRHLAARLPLWAGLIGCLFGFGCDGPGASLVLGPLPPRPMRPSADEDAGVEIPAGSRPCKRNDDCFDGVECTRDECLPAGYCSVRLDHARCGDGVVCNGVEVCDARQGCIRGPAMACDDRDTCTVDHCDEKAKGCVHDARDFDRDGEVDYHCADGTDCDDFNAMRGASAREVCRDSVDNDCDDLVDEADCGAVNHDACDTALDVSAGGVFEVPCQGAVGDYLSTCSVETPMRDLVFTFILDAPQDVKFFASGVVSGNSLEAAYLTLQRVCGDIGSELQCAHGLPGDLRVRALPAGRYFLVVSTTFAARSILLNASYSVATQAPTNQTCEKALDVGMGGVFSGDFVDVADRVTSRCALPGQPDLFYKLTLREKSDIEVSAVGDESSSLVVSLRKGCPLESETFERCEVGPRIVSRYHEQPPGEYILVIEGPSSDEVSFGLEIAIVAPTPAPGGDTCDQPLPLMFGESKKLAMVGFQADVTSTCQSTGADGVLSFELSERKDLQFWADGADSVVSMALQKACGDIVSERVCRFGTPLRMRLHDVAPGKYFLVVDSPSASEVLVKVDALPPTPTVRVVANDTCYSAAEIPLSGGLFEGDTSLLTQDYSAACGGEARSRDAAFRLVLPVAKRVVATVDSSFDSVLLRFDQGTAPSDMLCTDPLPVCDDDSGPGGGSAPQLDSTLPAGTYYFVVDGYDTSEAGEYVFDVAITDP